MAFQLPDLSKSMVNRLGVCSVFPKSLFSTRVVRKKHIYKNAAYGDGCFIQAIIGRFSDGDIHYHINLASTSYFDGDLPNTDCTLPEVLEAMDPFAGRQADFTILRAGFSVPARKLPASGLVKGLTGMSTTVAGEQLELVGAKFLISGSLFDQVEWEWNKGKSKTLAGRIAASRVEPILEDDFLLIALSTAEDGMRRFFVRKGA